MLNQPVMAVTAMYMSWQVVLFLFECRKCPYSLWLALRIWGKYIMVNVNQPREGGGVSLNSILPILTLYLYKSSLKIPSSELTFQFPQSFFTFSEPNPNFFHRL